MNTNDLDLIERRIAIEARRSFWVYRRYLHPKHKPSWFQYEVCSHLQEWLTAYQKGERPVLILNTPPQHGKSDMVIDFAAWMLGQCPELKVIYASFSERLSIRANLTLQRTMSGHKFQKVFPSLRLPKISNSSAARSREYIEMLDAAYEPLGGYFRNTTVRGSITGESLDVGIIDDPIKGREEANSPAIRDKTWDWFTDDFLTRFSDAGGLISIATRWHLDDPIGRLIKLNKGCRVYVYQAIAERDEKHRKAGEALFPEHKSLEFLQHRKALMSIESWQSLYQQNPVAVGGNLIKTDYFKRYAVLPRLKYLRIFVDTASKISECNDYTVFGLYGAGEDGGLYVIDILRGRWEYTPMKQRARDFWNKYREIRIDGYYAPLRDMAVEDKSAGIQLIQDLRSEEIIPITPIQRSKDKYTRLQNVIGYINSGYVHLPENAPWVHDFIEECQAFTGKGDTHDDQVDTFIDALQFILADTAASMMEWENLDE